MLTLLKTSFLLLVRDRGNLFFILLFPSLLVLVLGNALASFDNAENPIEPFTVEYKVNTTDSNSLMAIDAFVNEVNKSETVTFLLVQDDNSILGGETSSETSGEIPVSSAEKLKQGTIAAFVVFTQASAQSPTQATTQAPVQPLGIELYEGLDSAQNRAVNMILEGFSAQTGAYNALAQSYTQAQLGGDSIDNFASDPTIPNSALASNALVSQQIIAQQLADIPPTTNMVSSTTAGYQRSMLDYYAVTMIVMILVMGGSIGGASLLYDRRKEGTLRRELSTASSRTQIYLQFLLETLLQNIIQVSAVMLCSVLLFGAHYGATWQDNLLLFTMLLAAGMAISALFLIVGLFINLNPVAILMPTAWVFLFLSGTFSRPIKIPGLSEYMPTSIVQNAAFDITIFGNTQAAFTVLIVSICIIVAATALGTVLFNRKEVL
ncbi:permease [Actinomycetota bacterium]|nr:permease [Actinomycetota bacterium]